MSDSDICECGKFTYRSPQDAWAALRRVQQRRRRRGASKRKPEQAVYRCPLRTGWHLTSTEVHR